jgi:hypothetical protein
MHVNIVVPENTARTAYVLEWLFGQQLGVPYRVSTAASTIAACTIAYGVIVPGCIHMPATGLLRENGIREQALEIGSFEGVPVLFAAKDNGYELPFDLFSAVFYLLSRYEEYLPFVPDKHNRYPATDSILYHMDCLQRPLVDEWVSMLAECLIQRGIPVKRKQYNYLPTYDIDMAWSYRHKGLLRNAGGLAADLLKGRLGPAVQRLRVLGMGAKDPFDSFSELDQWHRDFGCDALYFVLCADGTTAYDKNTSLGHPAMVKLLRRLAAQYKLGIHPSYYTEGNKDKAIAELRALSAASGQQVSISRQHYIKLQLPDTYRMLIEMGIQEDFSMGYGAHFGFRAGTANSFCWYDLQKERVTKLKVHPFCFMDATSRYYPGMGATTAFALLREMQVLVERHHGTLITVCHNFTLGTDRGWPGWADAYADWLREQHTSAQARAGITSS